MPHFAEIKEGVVERVLVVPSDQEARGAEYLAVDLGLGGVWVQCSYSGSIRKQFPGPGYAYDQAADVFVAPQPYPSWALDANHDWQPPVPMPKVGLWAWDESANAWVTL